jgi:hypothetical protein
MSSIKKQMMTKGTGMKRVASPSQSSNWIISLALALQALAVPAHVLGMSIQPGDAENLGSECPMHQDAVGNAGKDDACECSGGLCLVGSAGQYAHTGPAQSEGVSRDTVRKLFPTSVRPAPRERHSIYQSRAPPSISLF